jgi:diguanylate cyclase (GGDEF)-like protein
MLGFSVEDAEIEGGPKTWFSRVHPNYVEGLRMDLAAHVNGDEPMFESEYRMLHRDGHYRWILSRATATRDEKGNAVEIAGVQTDVTRLIEVENRLIEDALRDRLTGLPNRSYLTAHLERACEQQQQDPRRRFAVLFLDLDGFKEVNDTLGHLVGDELLAAAAKRLRAALRPDDLVARFGGDEFVIILDSPSNLNEVEVAATRIHERLTENFVLGEHRVTTKASIGIVMSSGRDPDPNTLIRNADIAMYAAKSEGQGQTRIYMPSMYSRTERRWNLENELQVAIKRDELRLVYQPQISLTTGAIVGAEALLRWDRGDGQTVSPAEFIPLAEKSDLILEIGEWVLRQACEEVRRWHEEHGPSWISPKMSVNLSARQLKQHGFADRVIEILTESGLATDAVQLELTETVLIDSLEHAPDALENLSRQGVSLAIDDFGTGYSSMSYLRRLTANIIKLDRSFVTDVATDGRAGALAKSIINLSHDLGLTVVAEGVENQRQLDFLRFNRCDTVQGYLTGRPISEQRFRDLLVRNEPYHLPGRTIDLSRSTQDLSTQDESEHALLVQ